jgi:uncharacterized protein (DUF58 family)
MRAKISYRLFPLSFSITKVGILYLLAIFALSAAILRTSNNLLYLILATMISAFAVSSIVARNSLKHLSMSIRLPARVFAGDRVPVKISIRNGKNLFPSFSVRVEDPGKSARSVLRLKKIWNRKRRGSADSSAGVPGEFRPAAYFPVLPADTETTRIAVHTFPRRGRFAPDTFRLSTRFPFGLFVHTERVPMDGEILVYPTVKNISSHYQRLPFLPGPLESSGKGQGGDLFSIRPYRDGESARVIDWKATAKTRELMSREFVREEEPRLLLILDTQVEEKERERYRKPFEEAVSLCASLTAYFLGRGAYVELLTPDSHVPGGSGHDKLFEILKLLATIDYTGVRRPVGASTWMEGFFPGVGHGDVLKRIFTDKTFKIILTSKNGDAYPREVRHSAHLIYFDEL